MSEFDHLDSLASPIIRRDDANLNFDAAAARAAGRQLVLDSNTIIAALKRKLPQPVRELIATSRAVASSVVMGELTQGLFNLKPTDPRTAANRIPIKATIDELAKIEILVPTHEDWLVANAIRAAFGRCCGFDKAKRREILADTLIYVSVRRAGLCLVTGNTTDFDYLEQVLPGGDVLYYRATA